MLWLHVGHDQLRQIVDILKENGANELADEIEKQANKLDGHRDLVAEAYVAAARAKHHLEGVLEFEPDAAVSMVDDGDHGAYVQGWKWIEVKETSLVPADAPAEQDFDARGRPVPPFKPKEEGGGHAV